jgi:site-specific DNA recombinase
MKKVIGYIRVSTDKQDISPAIQRTKLEAYCTVKDWTLSDTIEDLAQCSATLKRPGMQRLLAMIEAGEVETVIVYKLDRLTRSVADLDTLVKLFERKGVALVSLQESLDATTATGRLMMNLLASVSQWEREVIGERTKDAMRHLRSEGKSTGGDAPYGWTLGPDGVHLEVNPKEQDAIFAARELREQGHSLRAIAQQLVEQGHRPRKGNAWHPETVKHLLSAKALEWPEAARS